jgi:hypothetical protein
MERAMAKWRVLTMGVFGGGIAICGSGAGPVRRRFFEEVEMSGFMEYAAFAGAVIASIGLALGLEWLGLNGIFRLMPGRAHERVAVELQGRTDAHAPEQK